MISDRLQQSADLQRKIALFVLSVVSFVILWTVGSQAAAGSVPQLTMVMESVVTTVTIPDHTGNTGLYHLGVTLLRVACIIAITLAASLVLGILMGTKTELEAPVANILPVWMAMPGLVVILFSLVLFGFSNLSIIIAVTFLSLPYGTVNIWKGIQAIDTDLVEMATVFDFDTRAMWRQIYLPSVLPFLFASSRYLLAMIWKITLTAEVFGAQVGIGAMIRFWFSASDITQMLTYFTLFLAAVFVIEYGILVRLERRAFAYRDTIAS